MGLFGSDRPARLRRMAPATAETASSWPMTRSCSLSSRSTSFSISPCIILDTGMPVHVDTTSAISSCDTSSLRIAPSSCLSFRACSACCKLALQLGDAAVADLGGLHQVAFAGRALLFGLRGFKVGLERSERPR